MTSQMAQPEFSPWRQLIWPIHRDELKKFLPLAFIMFGVLFIYTLLRDTKDSLVVNSLGASALPFLKLYIVTPGAILFVIFYAKLSNMFKQETVFYLIIAPFLLFFIVFAWIIYPNFELLHPDPQKVQALTKAYPRFKDFIHIFAYWGYSVFYFLAELWGSSMLALMFWQFANHVVRMSESKRFYGLFVVIGNISLIFSGQVVKFCSTGILDFLPEDVSAKTAWQISLYLLMGTVMLVGIATALVYRWMHKNVLVDPKYFDASELKTGLKKKKKKPSLTESFMIIVKSPELGFIAILIMAYGISINLLEIQWKEQLGTYFGGNKAAYNAFMGDFSTWTGIITIIFSLLFGSNILRILSWFKAAVITPITILMGGVVFFGFILSSDVSLITGTVASMLDAIGTNAVAAAAFLGAGIVILSKSIKYSLFDPTKEMAYIPLDDELKTKGKAAVDVIGGRAGKAGGSFIQSNLIFLMSVEAVRATACISFIIFALVCVLWIVSVKYLSVKVANGMARKAKEMARQDKLEEKEAALEGGSPQPAS